MPDGEQEAGAVFTAGGPGTWYLWGEGGGFFFSLSF